MRKHRRCQVKAPQILSGLSGSQGRKLDAYLFQYSEWRAPFAAVTSATKFGFLRRVTVRPVAGCDCGGKHWRTAILQCCSRYKSEITTSSCGSMTRYSAPPKRCDPEGAHGAAFHSC